MGALRLAAMGLRIAFDYTAAASHWPGVGRYGRELVRALVRLDACPELVLFECGRPGPLPTAALGLDTDMARERVRRIVLPGRERVRTWKARWLRRGIERALGPVDLVHRAQLERPPVFGLPCVLPLFELPAGGPTVSFDALKHLVVGSAAGRQVVLNELGLDPARISAVRTGAGHWLRDVAPAQERDAEWAARAAAPHTLVVLGALRHARRTLDILAGFEALYATRQDVRLAFDGLARAYELFVPSTARLPAPAMVLLHGGGYLPFYSSRADHTWEVRPETRVAIPDHPPSYYMKQLYYDTMVFQPLYLRHLIEVVGVDRVMLGTDYPFDMGETDPLQLIGATDGLTEEDRSAISGGNAARVFGLT